MATATKIHLSPTSDTGVFSTGVREDSARAASEVLQEDMQIHHVFFNYIEFHSMSSDFPLCGLTVYGPADHIVHLILSIYALGAAPDEIRAAYKRNKSYQRPVYPSNESVIRDLHNTAKFQECLGKEENYPNFLAFFQHEIDAKGVGQVLREYVFARDERAETMLCRLYGGMHAFHFTLPVSSLLGLGLIHPLIHLGFGLEFNQPAIVAQALAQTAVHHDDLGRLFLLPAEKMAGGIGNPGQKSLMQLLNEIRTDTALTESVQWSDVNKIRDGVLARAPDKMIKYASEFTVSADQMQERLAEMINTVGEYYSLIREIIE